MVHFLQFSWSTNCHTCNLYCHLAQRLIRIVFDVCQAEGRGFESRPWPKAFCAGFFWLGETLFRKFFKCLQRIPHSFSLFCKKMDVQKVSKAPLIRFRKWISKQSFKKIGLFFQLFPHAFTVEENTWHIEVLLVFLSLRYAADLGRSRLAHLLLPNNWWCSVDVAMRLMVDNNSSGRYDILFYRHSDTVGVVSNQFLVSGFLEVDETDENFCDCQIWMGSLHHLRQLCFCHLLRSFWAEDARLPPANSFPLYDWVFCKWGIMVKWDIGALVTFSVRFPFRF